MKICPVSKKCGGCQDLKTPYELQAMRKQQMIADLFKKETLPILKMADPYHYRHKIYARFGYDHHHRLVGNMYEESTHHLVNSSQCLIQHTMANQLIKDLCQLCQELKIEPYDEKTRKGILRHVYLRIAKEDQSILMVIVTSTPFFPKSNVIVQKMIERYPQIKTIILNQNAQFGSMILGKQDKVLYGNGYIQDWIDGVSFRISARSFYQVNPVQMEKMYQRALDMANIQKQDVVLDMCCGIGTMTLLAARKAKHVIGVEIVPQAIQDAIYNAKQNRIKNVSFYCDDMTAFMEKLMDRPDVVLLDPPRSGMGERFMQQLLKLSPKKIVYVSCNPYTQKQDLMMIEGGYRIEKILPIDLFPFTKHVETVVLMTKVH